MAKESYARGRRKRRVAWLEVRFAISSLIPIHIQPKILPCSINVSHPHLRTALELGSNEVIGAALMAPAFTSDLSTWWLTISNEGLITQKVHQKQPPRYTGELITLKRQLSDSQLASVCELLISIRFLEFGDEYSCGWTGLEQTKLVARIGNKEKSVLSYGPYAAAQGGDKHMQGYVKLWDAIEDLAPFDPVADY